MIDHIRISHKENKIEEGAVPMEKGENTVVISWIIFSGKRNIDWHEVEKYLEKYVGDIFEVAETKDIIHIGKAFPDEYTGSEYTQRQKGKSFGKVKANLVQVIPQLIYNGFNKRWNENKKEKHWRRAKKGWYRYDTKFAFPVMSVDGKIVRFDIHSATLIVNHSANDKLYLYDIQNIKKETNLPAHDV